VSRARRWIVLVVCALAGGALNVYRHVWWQSGGTPQMFGFCAPAELQAHDLLRFAAGYCRIEIPEARWRPLDVTIRLQAPPPLPATAAVIGTAGRIVHVTADDPTMTTDAETVTVGEAWQSYTFHVTSPPRPQAPLALVLRVDQPPIADPLSAYVIAAPTVGRVDVTPRLTPRTLAWPIVSGMLFGIAVALLLPGVGMRRRRSTAPAGIRSVAQPAADAPAADAAATGAAARQSDAYGRSQRGAPRTRLLMIFAGLLLYFAIWAVMRPPYQTPDEVQHQMRASSVLRDPWFAQPGRWTVDPRFTNPLAYWPPPMLFKLFFHPLERLTRGEVTALKSVAWPDPSTRPPAEPYERAIASYPTLYYLTVFALAEPVTRLLGLTPYDSTYAYRLVSAMLAALCWTLVFVQLRRLPATRESATAIGALLVLNPMTGFMCSAVNVDAVNIPLAVLASLLFWRLFTTGEGEWWTLAALLATSWTKPSGLQLIGALFVAMVMLWIVVVWRLRRTRPSGLLVLNVMPLLTLFRAAILSWVTFYAWSPPRFLGGQPSYDTLTTFIAARWARAFEIWVTYWGRLGWLEYSVAPIWYVLVLVAVLIGIVCALWRPRGSRAFMLFAATLLAAFVAATLAGEFLYLPVSGYVLQGRHLLPASLGLALLVMHRVAPARIALLALLVLLNVLLLQATVDRYYNGQWKVATYALPFRR
jgi:hypothetical protein